jgi:hypothetical protein
MAVSSKTLGTGVTGFDPDVNVVNGNNAVNDNILDIVAA